MKKLMVVLVFAMLLTTTTLLFANTDKEIEEIPSGAPEVESVAETVSETVSEESDIPRLKNGVIFVDQHHNSFIKDDEGNLYNFESFKGFKIAKVEEEEAGSTEEVRNAEEQRNAEEEKNTKATTEESNNESQESKTSNGNASKTSNDKNVEDSSATSASEITTVAATPPRSPNVPSYSMSSIGIHHNDEGAVTVVYPNAPQKRLRVLVEKGGERSAYNLHDGGSTADAVATYPLQRGDGTYLVRIMENTEGNSYREVYRKEVTLKSQQKYAAFLNSVQEINWSSSDPAIQKAAQLTAGMSSDREKVQAIYNYIVGNVKYDHDKVDQLNIFYLPNINNTFSTNKGICYDYASLFAAMLRSQGIPTRMVKGYSDAIGNGEVYHAWNEVYLASEDRWIIIDTTHDATYVQAGRSVDMIKGSGGFSVTHRL